MPEFGQIPSLLSGFTPGAAGIWTLVVMFAAFLVREWRETRKLSASDRLARREGYAAQVAGLQKENRELRTEMQRDRTEHEEYRKLCHAETDQLRRQVIDLTNEVEGLKRQQAMDAIAQARARDGGLSAETAAALPRTERHFKEKGA